VPDPTPDDADTHYTVSPSAAGQRLDRWLADAAHQPRAAVRRAIDQHRVHVNGRRAAPGHALAADDVVTLDGPLDDRLAPPTPWHDAPIATLAQGADWIAVDKPAGTPVHPLHAGQTRTALNAVVARRPEIVGIGEAGLRSGVVHRLDVATSGVLLFATTPDRWQRLRDAFTNHLTAKRYAALVHGSPDPPQQSPRLRLTVRKHRPARVAVVPPDQPGRDCSLDFAVVDRNPTTTRLDVDLHTGFLHQVRVTLAHLGHPVVGDPVYGRPNDLAPRLMLHAQHLAIDDIDVTSPAPFTLD